jgi:hypothetical protein
VVFGTCAPVRAGCIIGGGFICPGSTTTLPIPTFQYQAQSSTSTATQTWAATLGAATPQRFLIFALGGFSNKSTVTGITVAPNVGSTVSLSQAAIDSASNHQLAIWSGVLLADADAATTATITITYSANPTATTPGVLWTVPSLNMFSQTPVGTGNSSTASSTTSTTSLATASGGFVVALGQASSQPNTPSSITGTETYTTQSQLIGSGLYTGTAGNASGTATNASSSVTSTYNASTTVKIVAASWR